jgi:[acyl-carrier-protein] S-malonyltransferase
MVFQEVDEALGEKLSALIFEGPIETLTLTANAQPALMATSLAAVRALEERLGAAVDTKVSYVAGHSLGEYSALAAAGAVGIGDAARLLRLRGQAMQDAVPPGEGAMAAILGLDPDKADEVAREAGAHGICELANDNADGQAVVSGSKDAVERAMTIAKEKGAKRVLLLQVSAPFHCALMAPAAARLAEALAITTFSAPSVPLIANVTAEPVTDPALLADLLVRQATSRVRWRESMATMARLGTQTVLELGAGKVLTGLAKRGVPGAAMLNLAEPADLDTVAAALA